MQVLPGIEDDEPVSMADLGVEEASVQGNEKESDKREEIEMERIR